MKTLILGVILFQSMNYSLAQSIVTTDGNYSANASGSLSWSMGEIVTETVVNTPYQLTQGFQQVFIDDSGVDEIPSNSTFQVFPNPFVSGLNITIEGEHAQLTLKVYDYQNKLIVSQTSSFNSTQDTYWINLASLSCGFYIIVLENETSGELYYKRIVKSTK